jgi:hypothetical protein
MIHMTKKNRVTFGTKFTGTNHVERICPSTRAYTVIYELVVFSVSNVESVSNIGHYNQLVESPPWISGVVLEKTVPKPGSGDKVQTKVCSQVRGSIVYIS